MADTSTTSNGWLDSILNTGLGFFKAAKGADTPVKTAQANTTATNWGQIALIGGIALVAVLGLAFLIRR